MKQPIKQVFRLYNFIFWIILSLLGLVALGQILRLAYLDIITKKEIFILGALILIIGVLLIEIFFITRVIKYIKLLKNNK